MFINVFSKTLNRKLDMLEKRETHLRSILLQKEEDLNMSKKEVKNLMNLLNVMRSENINLQSKIEDARHLILVLQQNFEEQKIENDKLKKQMDEMGSINELQNSEIEKLHEELLLNIKKIDEMKVAEAMNKEIHQRLSKEFEELKEVRSNLENDIFTLREELRQKSDEVIHRQMISEKQKENLSKYVEQNQILMIHHEENEKLRIKLEYDVEKLKEELKILQDKECFIGGELVEKKQAIYQLNLEKLKLQSYIRDLETVLKERNRLMPSPDEKGDNEKLIIDEQEEIIENLTFRLQQMSQYIIERDETIKLIESQLKASTELMLEESESEERQKSNYSAQDMVVLRGDRVSLYKTKLRQAMQHNWRLVNMVNKLQHINYSLLSGKPNVFIETPLQVNAWQGDG